MKVSAFVLLYSKYSHISSSNIRDYIQGFILAELNYNFSSAKFAHFDQLNSFQLLFHLRILPPTTAKARLLQPVEEIYHC